VDEVVQEAIRSIREDVSGLHADFKAHVLEDQQALSTIGKQIAEWSGQLSTIKWLSGAILTAIIAYGAKHW
jgi:hypothetical protein